MGAKMKKEWDSNKIFKGIFPALLTPITEEGIIRRDGLKKLIDWELYHGADGFYIGGATGECYSMETEAREELAKEALRVIDGRGRCIVHIGAYSVREGRGGCHICDSSSGIPLWYGRNSGLLQTAVGGRGYSHAGLCQLYAGGTGSHGPDGKSP